ncbi:MAG: cytochrome c biogenesis protein CcdA [Ignavibacteriales bacterium]|nr:cytochrome c biogenesis protein CcdA [Ignavibacteriales bacterium]MCF8316603.1 cytochrome c biogenesis protein CcdA [Ignavibacteriales bacterium]MCF8438277.1 cytochrome c biogenesis protein CcdA [Ignavibacteriales bacterium]
MFENLFTALYEALNGTLWIALPASFFWGVLSVLLSPCHLSSIPLIVGFISSQGKISVSRTFSISMIFSVGILVTIAIIGLITASLGRLMGDVGIYGNYFVAGIFFVVGLYLLDIIKLEWDTIGIHKTKTSGLAAALILGLLFGIALGPCTFAYMAPVLGIVFQTAQSDFLLSVIFLFAFGIGHCSVIVGAGTLTGKLQKYLDWSEGSRTILWTKRICGILVILGGIYLIFTTI